MSKAEFRHIATSHGDAGKTAFEVLDGRTTPEPFVSRFLSSFSSRSTSCVARRRKKNLLQNRLARLSSLEGQYLVKILSGDLRIGLREGLVEEAVAEAFSARSTR